MPMPKQPLEADDDFAARFYQMVDIALASVEEARGTALTDGEVDAVVGWCGWYAAAMLNGCHPIVCAAAMYAESRGTQTWH